ncbi:MAG: DUF3089 domain-containing protein [Bacteroidetes bacterium]|nr:DUF3089 domain-containing protein [Bacteroidota bacterium]
MKENYPRNDNTKDTDVPVDYSVPTHWLSNPLVIKKVDVFYIYPTVWINTGTDPVCKMDNPQMLTYAPVELACQATAFDTIGNIFAPFYRQADAAYVLRLSQEEKEAFIGGIPTGDVTAAFDYYIKHFNNNRPFILAGHSQGSNILIHLLSGYMKLHPDVYQRMIAAYVIGTPVTQSYLDANTHLRFATGPDDFGVIISYNTQAPDVDTGENPVVGNQVGLVINPINWKRDSTHAAASEGLGGYIMDGSNSFVRVPQFADARIDATKGVLICSSADEDALYKMNTVFHRGVYHGYDYAFYYYNLRANAANRVSKYFAAHPGN